MNKLFLAAAACLALYAPAIAGSTVEIRAQHNEILRTTLMQVFKTAGRRTVQTWHSPMLNYLAEPAPGNPHLFRIETEDPRVALIELNDAGQPSLYQALCDLISQSGVAPEDFFAPSFSPQRRAELAEGFLRKAAASTQEQVAAMLNRALTNYQTSHDIEELHDLYVNYAYCLGPGTTIQRRAADAVEPFIAFMKSLPEKLNNGAFDQAPIIQGDQGQYFIADYYPGAKFAAAQEAIAFRLAQVKKAQYGPHLLKVLEHLAIEIKRPELGIPKPAADELAASIGEELTKRSIEIGAERTFLGLNRARRKFLKAAGRPAYRPPPKALWAMAGYKNVMARDQLEHPDIFFFHALHELYSGNSQSGDPSYKQLIGYITADTKRSFAKTLLPFWPLVVGVFVAAAFIMTLLLFGAPDYAVIVAFGTLVLFFIWNGHSPRPIDLTNSPLTQAMEQYKTFIGPAH